MDHDRHLNCVGGPLLDALSLLSLAFGRLEIPELGESVQDLVVDPVGVLRQQLSATVGYPEVPSAGFLNRPGLIQISAGPVHPVIYERLLAAGQQLLALLVC